MAIYVKGMEMPNSCDDCPINNDWRCALRINTPHQHNIDAGAWKYRMGWCPLVEVPVDEERRAMTREEAIRKLKRELEAIEGDWRFKEFAEALDMAIEALRNEINCVKCQYYTERETYTGIKGVCKMDTAHREELISRSRAIKEISEWATDILHPKNLIKEDAIGILESLPSAEPKTGYWYIREYEYFTCSECGEDYWNSCDSTAEAEEKLETGDYPNFCSNCGADMRGEEE